MNAVFRSSFLGLQLVMGVDNVGCVQEPVDIAHSQHCTQNYTLLLCFAVRMWETNSRAFRFVVTRPNSTIEQIHIDRHHNAANKDMYHHTKLNLKEVKQQKILK